MKRCIASGQGLNIYLLELCHFTETNHISHVDKVGICKGKFKMFLKTNWYVCFLMLRHGTLFV